MVIIAFQLMFTGYGNQAQSLFSTSTPLDSVGYEDIFEEVKSLILENYYSEELTEKDLYWASIEGMLRHISPPENPDLARIWTPDEYQEILNSLKGEDISLGIKTTFNPNDGSLTVNSISPGSPADGKLETYDRILKINDTLLMGRTTKQVNELLEGPEDSEVRLTVNRGPEIFNLTVVRKKYKVDLLRVFKIPQQTALIEIKKIYDGLSDELARELELLKEQNIRRLIIDLRNNSGGVLNEGIKTANLFLEDRNIILRTMSKSDKSARPIVASSEKFYNFELIILINGNTASASEIIASALQEHNRATIIGNKTYGKGVIETTYKLPSDYRVKFITSAMYSPSGKSWQSKGVLPDLLVEQNDEVYERLSALEVTQRIRKDIFLITAYKLFND